MLPQTVLSEVFSYLSTREQCELRLASKQWDAIATDVALNGISISERTMGVLPILEKYATRIKDVEVKLLNNTEVNILKAFPNLTRLLVLQIKRNVPWCMSRLGHVEHLIFYPGAKKLNKTNLSSQNLRTLQIYVAWGEDGINEFFDNSFFPSLRYLKLKSFFCVDPDFFVKLLEKFSMLKAVEGTLQAHGSVLSFLYDVNKFRFREIRLYLPRWNPQSGGTITISTSPRMPEVPSQVIHHAQFCMLGTLHGSQLDSDALKSLATINKVEYTFINGVEGVASVLVNLLYVPHLVIHVYDCKNFGSQLPKKTFGAHTVELNSNTPITGGLCWLASCFPNLEKVSLSSSLESTYAFDGALIFKNLNTIESLGDFSLPFWRCLVAVSPKLVKILLRPDSLISKCISHEFPEIFVGIIVPIA